MFNLGFKQIVINSTSVVNAYAAADVSFATPLAYAAVVEGDIVRIDGFGDFLVPAQTEGLTPAAGVPLVGAFGTTTVSAAAALGVYTAVIAGFDAAKKYDIKLKVKNARDVAGIYTGHSGDIWTFQTGAGASFGLAAAAGQIAGFNDDLVKFSANGADLVITFQAGLEGMTLESLEVLEAAAETDMPITSIAITQAPSYGVGLGKQIEEEVMNSTGANLDPYGVPVGGKNGPVDVRGTYTEIYWKSATPMNGFEPHAMTGYGDANTEATHVGTEQIAYLNEASVSAAVIQIMSRLTGLEDEL